MEGAARRAPLGCGHRVLRFSTGLLWCHGRHAQRGRLTGDFPKPGAALTEPLPPAQLWCEAARSQRQCRRRRARTAIEDNERIRSAPARLGAARAGRKRRLSRCSHCQRTAHGREEPVKARSVTRHAETAHRPGCQLAVRRVTGCTRPTTVIGDRQPPCIPAGSKACRHLCGFRISRQFHNRKGARPSASCARIRRRRPWHRYADRAANAVAAAARHGPSSSPHRAAQSVAACTSLTM